MTVTFPGDANQHLTMCTSWPRPSVKAGQLLIRVLACSTAAGDVHMMSGRLSLVLKPPAWPYVPGMDVCGVVEEIGAGAVSGFGGGFSVGDIVVATNGANAWGGLAELMAVDAKLAAPKPDNLSPVMAAACPVSAVTALHMVEKEAKVKKGDRVLVLGGSGGVGTAAVQLAKVSSRMDRAPRSSPQRLPNGVTLTFFTGGGRLVRRHNIYPAPAPHRPRRGQGDRLPG
jgi:NADPH:quinone reductase-like Zn-dependent oxidoreductase